MGAEWFNIHLVGGAGRADGADGDGRVVRFPLHQDLLQVWVVDLAVNYFSFRRVL